MEGLSNYLIGHHQTRRKSAFQLSAVAVSLLCGVICFVGYGVYELVFPAPNPKGNMWLFLLFLSSCVAVFAYIVIVVDHLIKKRRSAIVIRSRVKLFGFLLLFAIFADIKIAFAEIKSNENGITKQEAISIHAQTVNIRIPIQSWKTLRDARVVKQDLDYSCSAASLATLLNEFYGQSVTEEALLKVMDKDDLRASFDDMQRALPQFGFKAQGFAASYEQLMKLKAPVVVYLKHRKDDHFSVLRGIDENRVWLADPSLGNRTYSREQFLSMWQTRADKDNAELAGKFLAVLPNSDGISASQNFFTKAPQRQSAQAVEQLSFRSIP